MAKPPLKRIKKMPFSCKRLTSTRLEGGIIGKTLTMPKQEDIILNSMTQTKEKWNSLAWP